MGRRHTAEAIAIAPAWAEAATQLDHQRVPDDVCSHACEEFNEAELTQLTLAAVAINGWNRFDVACHAPAASYKSPIAQKAR